MKKWLIWAVIVIAIGSRIVYSFDVPYTKYITQSVKGVQIQLGATDNESRPGEGLSKNDHGLSFEFEKYGKTFY